MKKTLLFFIILLFGAFLSLQAQTTIASTSFEDSAAIGGQYTDTGAADNDHHLPNNAGEPIVNYYDTENGDEIGFQSYYYNTRSDVGLTDGDYVGVTDYAGTVGAYTDGAQGFQMSDTDGLMEFVLDTVDISGYADVKLYIDVFVQETGWETDDFIKVYVEVGGSNIITLLNTDGQDIDDLAIEDAWETYSTDLTGFSEAVLKVGLQSNSANEAIFMDNIIFEGTPLKDVFYDISLSASDGLGGSLSLYTGIDSTATDGIDSHLNEATLAAVPPAGTFDARFILPDGTTGSFRDYRNGGYSFVGSVDHQLDFQLSTGSSQFVLDIDIPFVEGTVTMDVNDGLTGLLVDETYDEGVHQLVINNPTFGSLDITINYQPPIPVEMTLFRADVAGRAVQLEWETATETNNKGFEVLRSTDNKNFEKVNFVEGHGTTSEKQNYVFTDANLSGEKYYYRLKQVDFDGTYSLSKVLEVNLGVVEFELSQNYPNPFNPSTVIKFSVPGDAKVLLNVYNAIGEKVADLVNRNYTAGVHEVTFDASEFTSGIYYYNIKAAGIDGKEFSQTRKMLLVK